MISLFLSFLTGWFAESQPLLSILFGTALLAVLIFVFFRYSITPTGMLYLILSFIMGVSHDPIIVMLAGGLMLLLSVKVKNKKIQRVGA